MVQTPVSLPDTGVCRHTEPLPFSKRAFYPPGLPDRGIESPWKSAGISCELDRDTNAAIKQHPTARTEPTWVRASHAHPLSLELGSRHRTLEAQKPGE